MDPVNAALQDLHGTSPVYNAGRFSNHAPMVVETLAHLGHAADVPAWLAPRRHRYGPVLPGRDLLTPAGWTDALGDRDRYADWQELFRHELESRPWQEVVNQWTGRLAPGFTGHLFHGVIRVAHAVRGLEADDAPTRLVELSDALAYWASVYERLPGEPDALQGEPERHAYAALRRGTLTYLADAPLFPIIFVHAVTGAAAALRLLPYLGSEQQAAVSKFANHGVRWVAAQGSGTVPAEKDEPLPPRTLIAMAVASGDEHAVKLTDVCVDAFAASDDPIYLIAADDGIGRFTEDV